MKVDFDSTYIFGVPKKYLQFRKKQKYVSRKCVPLAHETVSAHFGIIFQTLCISKI